MGESSVFFRKAEGLQKSAGVGKFRLIRNNGIGKNSKLFAEEMAPSPDEQDVFKPRYLSFEYRPDASFELGPDLLDGGLAFDFCRVVFSPDSDRPGGHSHFHAVGGDIIHFVPAHDQTFGNGVNGEDANIERFNPLP